MAGTQRSNYDLRERICIGSMTAMETAVYQQVPTDEAEAQMLASADLDDMKSKRELSWFLGLGMQVKSTISYEIDDCFLHINADNSLLFYLFLRPIACLN